MATYGLILAGGLSTRMGQDKAELKLGEKNLLEIKKSLLNEAGIEQVIISGKEKDQLNDLEAGLGPLAGIQAFCHAYPDAEDLLVLPVDMPALDTKALIELLNFGQHHKVSCCFDSTWLPAYFADIAQLSTIVDEILKSEQQSSRSINAVFKQMNGQTLPITNRAEMLINVNTPEQWQSFLTQFMNNTKEQ